MKRLFLTGAALAAVLATPAAGQGQPQPGSTQVLTQPPQTFEQMMQQQQRDRARQEASQQAAVERDLQRLTPEARDELIQYARDRITQVAQGPTTRGLGDQLRRDMDRNLNNILQNAGSNDAIVNLANAQANEGYSTREISNRQFGQDSAHGVVQMGESAIQMNREIIGTARPFIEEMARAEADIMDQRQRLLLQSNPNMSQQQRDQLRYETFQARNRASNIGSRLDQADFRMRGQQQQLRESEDRIASAMERMANEQGQDLTRWTPPARPTPTPASAPRPLPVPNAPPPPTPQAAPPPPAPTQTASSGGARGPVHRGTIPPADPYADFRVPQNQGGTGANPPPQNNQNQQNQQRAAAERARQQQQAEANAARTEQARQRAQQQADAENAQADQIFGAAERERQRRAAQQRAEMEDMIRQNSRPGQVGRGGASGGGGGTVDGAGGSGDPALAEPGQYSPTEAFVFEDGGSFPDLAPDPWASFELGGIITIAELVPIYDGYDWLNAPIGSSGRSLSSAGTSLSSAGRSLSSAPNSLSAAGSITPSSAPTGMRVDWGGLDLASDPVRWSNGGRPEPGSYADMLAQLNGQRRSLLPSNPWLDDPWATRNPDLARALYGPLWSDRPYQVQADPYGRRGRGMGGPEMGNLFDTDTDLFLRLLGSDFDYLRLLLASDRGGLDRILAQPFNVLLTWGPNAYDLDLHMTGPLAATTDRFHIYYAAPGQLAAAPFAQLIKDCICNSGSEVILTSSLVRDGGVYRVSVFNFGDQSSSSTILSSQSQATLQIVRGGTAVSVGNGTTIEGGTTLLTTLVPPGQAGNTWIAAEIDPRNGRITTPDVITTTNGVSNVD